MYKKIYTHQILFYIYNIRIFPNSIRILGMQMAGWALFGFAYTLKMSAPLLHFCFGL